MTTSKPAKIPTFLKDVGYSARDVSKYKAALRNSTTVLDFMREHESTLTITDYAKMMRIEIEHQARPSVINRVKGKFDKARYRQESLELSIYLASK